MPPPPPPAHPLVHDPWDMPLVHTKPLKPQAEAMPSLVVKSVSMPEEVIEGMLAQEEEKAGTTIS